MRRSDESIEFVDVLDQMVITNWALFALACVILETKCYRYLDLESDMFLCFMYVLSYIIPNKLDSGGWSLTSVKGGNVM